MMDGSPEVFFEESPMFWGLPRPGSQICKCELSIHFF